MDEIKFIKDKIRKEMPKEEIKELFYNSFAGHNFVKFEELFDKALHTYTDKPVPEVKEEKLKKLVYVDYLDDKACKKLGTKNDKLTALELYDDGTWRIVKIDKFTDYIMGLKDSRGKV